jgi:hypothetical protein
MKRFSLATLLLVTTVIALSVALFNATSALTKARSELSKLRNEIRTLDPLETDKMRAIEIPAFGQNQWRWKIDLPDDEKFVLRWAYNDIAADDSMPTQIDPVFNHPKFHAPELPDDEFILLVSAFEQNGEWFLGVKTESASGRGEMDFATEMKANDSSWLAKRGGNGIHALAGKRKTATNPIETPFVLLRYRKGLSPSPGVTAMDPNPTDGMLIWIEQRVDSKDGRTKR